MNPFVHGKKHEIGLDLFVKGFDKDHLSRAYLALTNTRETDRLILECATLEQMDAEYNEGDFLEEGIYEAVTVRRFSQTDSRMKALSRVFSKFLQDGITPAEAIIGKPKKSGLFASVTAQIPFSDGQAITIVFHSPSGDKKKIGPDDEIIAYRWLLNKRDITHVVSPEGEADVSLEEVGKRIAQLVGKNSARFQATQKDIKAQNDQLDALKADADKLSKENMDLMNGLKDHQDAVASTQAKVDRTRDLLGKQQEINSDLENQLAALQAKAKAAEADKKVAEEAAAKQAAMDAEFDSLKDEALSMGMDPKVFDQLKQDGMINDLKGIMAKQKQQSESDKQAEEYNRIRSVGAAAVPGIRSQDMEVAGKMWEMLQRGEVTQDEWDTYVEDLYASNKAPRPESVGGGDVITEIPSDELPSGWKVSGPLSKDVCAYTNYAGGSVTLTLFSDTVMVLAFDPDNHQIASVESKTVAEANLRAITFMSNYDQMLSDYQSGLDSSKKDGEEYAKKVLADTTAFFEPYRFVKDSGSGDFPTVYMDNPSNGTRLSIEVNDKKQRYEIRFTGLSLFGNNGSTFKAKSIDDMENTANRALAAYFNALKKTLGYIKREDAGMIAYQMPKKEYENTYYRSDANNPLYAHAVRSLLEDKSFDSVDALFKSFLEYYGQANEDAKTYLVTALKYSIDDLGKKMDLTPELKEMRDGQALYRDPVGMVTAYMDSHSQDTIPPEPQPPVEPTPDVTDTTGEPPAVAILNDLLSGAHDSDTVEFGRILDDAAGQLEADGLIDKYDALLNQAADYLTGLLRKKAA